VSERIDKLREAIETMHRCKAVHVGSEPVIESAETVVKAAIAAKAKAT
jgi:hypothetical protein